MVELALTLAIGTILAASQVTQIKQAVDSSLSVSTGQYMTAQQVGVNQYVLNNMPALAISSPVAGFANPLKPTVAELVANGYLPTGFSNVSPLGLSFTNALTLLNCPGTNCSINGLAYSSTPYKDGAGAIRSDVLADALRTAGLDGGMSYTSSPSQLNGFGGSWGTPASPVANPAGNVAGTIAIRVGTNSGIASQLLQFYKLDGSRKLAGAMDANGNNISNAGTVGAANVNASGNVTAAGNVNAAGTVNAGSVVVPGGNNLKVGNSVYYGDTANSAIRQNGGVYFQNLAGTAPADLAQVGNVNAQGNVTTAGETTTGGWFRTNGDSGWYSQKWNGGFYMSDGSWVRSYADKNMYTGGQMQAGALQSNSTLSVAGNATVGSQSVIGNQTIYGSTTVVNALIPGAIAWNGGYCGGNGGAIARDWSNNLYVCN